MRSVDEKLLHEYTGVYQWQDNGFLYLQIWNELTGEDQLVAFEESGEVRTLYSTDDNRNGSGKGSGANSAEGVHSGVQS